MSLNFLRRTGWLAAALAIFVLTARADTPLTQPEINQRGAAGTALVLRPDGNMVVAAFCVDRSGLFVTHERVGRGGQVLLVLDSGQPTQRLLEGTVLHREPSGSEQGLVLIQAANVKDVPMLPLADVAPEVQVLDLTTFTYPFTIGPTEDGKHVPVRVTAGKGIPVRHAGGDVLQIQLDAKLNPFGYGGPVLDNSGRVVGIVGPGYAFPASRVRRLLAAAPGKGPRAPEKPPPAPPSPDSLPSLTFQSATGKPLTKEEIIRRGTEATALVLRDRTNIVVAAFCVHPSGLFVSHERVLQYGGDGKLILVLNAGLPGQRVFPARVIHSKRTEKGMFGLAVIQAEGVRDLPALPLGLVEGRTESLEVIALGFPNTIGPPVEGKYERAQVKTGQAAVGKAVPGETPRLLVDSMLRTGSVGGPVLDRFGRVVAVMGPGFSVPATDVVRLFPESPLRFTPPALTRENLRESVLFEATFAAPPAGAATTVELRLQAGAGPERTFRMEAEDGRYRARVVPAPPVADARMVRLTVRFADSSVQGLAFDRSLKVAGREVRLRDVRSLRLRPKPEVVLRDGTTLHGAPAGLDAMEVRLGDEVLRVEPARAVEITCDTADEVTAVRYTLVALRDGKETARLEGVIPVKGPDAPGPASDR